MSKIIIGIHGLKNKPKGSLLEKWWEKAIREGLGQIGHPFNTFKFELVYWAHILYPEPLNHKTKNEKDPLFLEFPYVRSKHHIKTEPEKLRKKVLDYIDNGLDKLFLHEDMSINFASISDLIIRRYFRDLNIYYTTTCPDDENVNHVKVIDVNVYNDYEYLGKINPHSVYGYLRTPELAKVLYDFLSRDKHKTILWITEKISGLVNRFSIRHELNGDKDEPT